MVKKIKPHQRGEKKKKNKPLFLSYSKVKQRTKCLNHSVETYNNHYVFLLQSNTTKHPRQTSYHATVHQLERNPHVRVITHVETTEIKSTVAYYIGECHFQREKMLFIMTTVEFYRIFTQCLDYMISCA